MHINTLLAPLPVARDITAADVRAHVESSGVLVVLDDDPTGTQSVAGIPVLTRWERADLDDALATGARRVRAHQHALPRRVRRCAAES